MKRIAFLTILSLALTAPIAISQTLIDFESLTAGTTMASYTEAGVTFTATSGAHLSVFNLANSGTGIIGDTFPWSPVRADIASGATYVSVLLGDNSGDSENVYLEAYNSANVLLASDTAPLNGPGFLSLSVMTGIDYVIWGSTGTIPNSIIADEFTFNAIPEPTSLLALGLGLLGAAKVIRRRRRA